MRNLDEDISHMTPSKTFPWPCLLPINILAYQNMSCGSVD
jgi:hypothetical protein